MKSMKNRVHDRECSSSLEFSSGKSLNGVVGVDVDRVIRLIVDLLMLVSVVGGELNRVINVKN